MVLPASYVQAQPKLVGVADASKVELGYTVGISYTLENTDAAAFVPPALDGFKVVSGPNQQISSTFFNGKISQKQVWSFLLMALSPGKKEIPPASVQLRKGRVESNAITIEVTAASAATGSITSLAQKGESVFVQSKLSVDTAYIGQAVKLEHILYANLPVESYQLLARGGV